MDLSYECYACKKVFNRKDNFLRHYKEIHVGILKICECGLKITSTCLKRHQKNSCCLRKGSKSFQFVKILPKVRVHDNHLAEIQTYIKFNNDNTFASPIIAINGSHYTMTLVNQIADFEIINEHDQ